MHLATAIVLWVIAAFLSCGLVPLGVAVKVAEQRRTRIVLAVAITGAVLVVAVLALAGVELTHG